VRSFWLVVTALIAVSATALPAFAAPAKTVTIPATIVFRTAKFPTAKDPKRCVAVAFAQYPSVKKATSYSVRARGFKGSSGVTGGGPPFAQDRFPVSVGKKTVVLKVRPGKHWFVLGTSSTGEGCSASLAALKGRFAISRATAVVG
jgi:hypothetical protein